ncbi:hemerythrin domain-containing protein [Pelagibius sp. CAU 1746]|uniref:bacteriohemerythrin n=1 Tax=Pelagibius sp. CAU 1746 TaxID=3140370 RepID=UPI00325B876C
MKRFDWLESFELRVPEIDGDHRAMLELMKATRAAAAAGNRTKVEHFLDRLFALTQNHFMREETLLLRWGYPDAKTHAMYHQRLLDRAKAVRRACGKIESQEAFEECCEEMMTFLVDDVVRGDLKMKSFLQSNDLTLPD